MLQKQIPAPQFQRKNMNQINSRQQAAEQFCPTLNQFHSKTHKNCSKRTAKVMISLDQLNER